MLSTTTPLSEWLSYLTTLHAGGKSGIQFGLKRIQQVATHLGQKKFCPVITVGGTNGKGSCCAYLESIFRSAGYRVGCYTSPHLLHYNERVRVDGAAVTDEQLCTAFTKVESARVSSADGASPLLTYFEFGTLAALEVFASSKVDVIILEVGLGGRLDAVNIYDSDVALVTNISIDHTNWLGNDCELIGFEKAGIFRPNKPAVYAGDSAPASLLEHASSQNTHLRLIGRDFGFEYDALERTHWVYWSRDKTQAAQKKIKRHSLGFPGLRGTTQLYNASAAIAVQEILQEQLPVPMQAIRQGLITAELPGRFQVLPGKPTVVLDVAHNQQAATCLDMNLGAMGYFPKTIAVLGILADKEIQDVLLPVLKRIDHWYLCNLDSARSTEVKKLADCVKQALESQGIDCNNSTIMHFDSPAQAFLAARETCDEDDRIVVFGSFYTVSGALHALKNSLETAP